MPVTESNEVQGLDRAGWFETTHWSVVLKASQGILPEAGVAMETLCRAYWFPLYAYVRRCGESPDNAEDLTQEFFARLLEKDWLRAANPHRGRFRWFLLASLKHFLANQRDRNRTLKRGGRHWHVSLEELDPEKRYALEPADEMSADKAYDRSWALTLLERARSRLREEFSAAGRSERFEAVEPFLPGERSSATYAEVARRLGVAEGTVKS